MAKRIMSGAEHIAVMKLPSELLTFDEAMAALRAFGEFSSSSLWPTLSGNEVYAFANAAAEAYRRKTEASNVKLDH